MIDIKRYKEDDPTLVPTAPATPALKHTANETQSEPIPFTGIQQLTLTPNTVYTSNMGLDAAAGPNDANIQHFCYDCCMPFREDRMIKFRGLWYGVPCGDYQHAVDIFRKEQQRKFRPPRRNEPGDVPFVAATQF